MKKKIISILVGATVLLSMGVMGCSTNKKSSTKKESYSVTQEEIDSAKSKFSEDLNACEFMIDGEVYSYPMTPNDLITKGGWEFKKEQISNIKTVPNNSVTNAIQMYKGEKQTLSITVGNFSGETLNLENCNIGTVTLSNSCKSKIIMPKGITIGSTIDEVTEAYGSAEDEKCEYGIDRTYELTCSDGTSVDLALRFNVKTKKLETINYRYDLRENR